MYTYIYTYVYVGTFTLEVESLPEHTDSALSAKGPTEATATRPIFNYKTATSLHISW